MRGRPGFTLVEVLIAAAVVAILAAVGLASLRGSERANRLSSATRTVIGDIREVRSLVATGALPKVRLICGDTAIWLPCVSSMYAIRYPVDPGVADETSTVVFQGMMLKSIVEL